MSHLLIGSKSYLNLKLNSFIDNNFKNYYRMNLNITKMNSGNKNSNIQFLNIHMYDKYIKKLPLKSYIDHYGKLVTDKKYLVNYLNYINNSNSKFLYFPNNNTILLKKILKINNININIKKQCRAGYGGLAYLIEQGIKPFVIGFSLNNNNTIYKKKSWRSSNCHNYYIEGLILIQLHKKNLIDASLCLIKDCKNVTLDCNIFLPSIEILYILLNEFKGGIRLVHDNFELELNFVKKINLKFKISFNKKLIVLLEKKQKLIIKYKN